MTITADDVKAFVNWEGRPAVLLNDGNAYSIVSDTGKWERVSGAEVADSGRLVSLRDLCGMYPGITLADIDDTIPYGGHPPSFSDLKLQAEQGDAKAQRELGKRFRLGSFGTPEDRIEAAKWYRKAAAQGDVVSQRIIKRFNPTY
jgi:TPR repeat protein